MDTSGLFNVLSNYCSLSDAFRTAFENELIPVSLPKHHILLQTPNVATHAYFLSDGFAMSYSFFQGKRIVEHFWRTGDIIVALESFFERKPSALSIELMTNAELFCISYQSVQRMLTSFPEAQHIHRGYVNRHLEESLTRVRDMQRLTASERRVKLLREYPGIEQFVSQEAIASYLGITAQSLARIKRLSRH